MTQPHLLRDVKTLLDNAAIDGKPDEITLRHSLNEGWFSDALAWLLDPRGDHGLGVSFLRAFLKEVAKERCSDGAGYARRTRRTPHFALTLCCGSCSCLPADNCIEQ